MISQIGVKKLLSWIPVVVFFGVFINFIVFIMISLFIGGTAQNGLVADGKYYLGDHGLHEVSKEIYVFSEVYTNFTDATFPLAYIAFPFLFLNESVLVKIKKLSSKLD